MSSFICCIHRAVANSGHQLQSKSQKVLKSCSHKENKVVLKEIVKLSDGEEDRSEKEDVLT